MNKDIEQLHRKLKWYIYYASYEEYNEQEVEYILKKLKEYDPGADKEIDLSCITFIISATDKKKSTVTDIPRKNKNIIYRISFIAVASAALFAILLGDHITAHNQSGIFYFIEKGSNSFSFYVHREPEYNEYKFYEDVPIEWRNIIWIPGENDLSQYDLDYIRTKENPKLEYVVQHYVDHENDDFFEIKYYFEEEYVKPQKELISEYYYDETLISCYLIDLSNDTPHYLYHFQVSGSDYSVETSDPDIGAFISHKIIEFTR